MSTKHTPGPWSYHQAQTSPLSKIHAYEISTPAFDVASATPHVGIRREADARLMAAAPDLLEALKKVAQSLDWHAHGCCRGLDDDGPLPTNEAVELAKRTIAKAIGRDD